MSDPIEKYSHWLLNMSDHGKCLFKTLFEKILSLENAYPEPQEKSGHITFKIPNSIRKKDSRFCCIHPASVPHRLRKDRSKATSMTMHINNRSRKLEDDENMIIKYTKMNSKTGSYALINVSNEKEIDSAMKLVKQCYLFLKEDQ